MTASLSPDYGQRRQRLARTLPDEGVALLLLTNPINVTYLTGFSGDSSYLLLTRDRAVLVSDGRFTVQLAEECADLEAHIRPPSQAVTEAAAEVLTKLGARTAGFESGHLTVADFEALRDVTKGVDWKPARDRVEKLRALKDAWEVAQIRQAIRIAERAFAMFCAFLRPGDTEKELSDALEAYIRRAGGSGTSFPPIVAVGERAALPHAPPTERRVRAGELVLVDWGATGAFYKSDLTRVLVPYNNTTLPGQTSETAFEPKLQEVYDVVLRAQAAAIAAVRPGAKSGDVDAAARQVIQDAGYGAYFTHSIGHGLGLQIHEAPLMRPGSEIVLQAGMVITIEPGVYLPDWGGVRIEDDVLITADGCEVLTHVPKDLASAGIEA